jgi:hypothetical protein
MKEDFHRSIQNFIVNSYGVGVVRKMGPKGYLDNIREFLKRIELADVSRLDPTQFPSVLDDLTEKLCRHMPRGAKYWGVARKCLNLFFRDALYNFYLRKKYDLAKFEKCLEIPLDSHCGSELWKMDKRGLPRWGTVKGLKPEVSAKFQKVAATVARRKGTERVHLDVVYWRGGK